MIELSGVRIRFGEVAVLRGVSLAVAKGEVHALLGRTGAGKTTLLEVAAGLRRPALGTARLNNADPYLDQDAVRRGVVWREGGLFPGLTVAEVVDTWRRWTLDPVDPGEVLELTGLTTLADEPFERLDDERRRRLDLALALVGRADVLLLDEPMAGLAPQAADRIWQVLRTLSSHGVTILMSTPNANDACRADRFAILDQGHLVTNGNQALASRYVA
ncbi:ATP-binding cassette domain-containing protein [Actinomadura rubrisoli]|uniref:ATP-binding cassette domain-containing protein n=1 Tax=Actinomadura rubrisoli TaxID=2530368 RepID=UPI001FB7DBC7|nr:ATP-binding cassette domain-containing protein [Actinomadura rubrisoli]